MSEITIEPKITTEGNIRKQKIFAPSVPKERITLSEMKYPTPKEFLVEAPLYEWVNLPDDGSQWAIIPFEEPIDVYCLKCDKESVFRKNRNNSGQQYELVHISYYCTRNHSHELYFLIFLEKNRLQKIGQIPSLADLNLSDVKKYAKVLEKKYFQELTKAIGLVAHGVGVGSFVYLRRIFELLIEEAHQLATSHSDWNEDLYCNARVNEKIGLLRTELPDFLVENTAIYSILSKGIHELTEQECLAAFPVMKLGIEMILDDKLAKREKIEKQAQATKAIQELQSKHSAKAK